jgi:hypothetical protein
MLQSNLDIHGNIPYSIGKNLDKCLKILNTGLSFIENPNIISVGSGSGYFEEYVSKMLNTQVTCVDPKPFDYENKLCREPDYKTILDVEPEKLSKFNFLMLVWPSPNNYIKDKDIIYDSSEPFDYDALIRIMPSGFFTVYGPCGASGSDRFIDCIYEAEDKFMRCDGHTIDYSKLEFTLVNKEKSKTYKCVSSFKIIQGIGYGFRGKTIVYACFVDKSLLTCDYAQNHDEINEKPDDRCLIM